MLPSSAPRSDRCADGCAVEPAGDPLEAAVGQAELICSWPIPPPPYEGDLRVKREGQVRDFPPSAHLPRTSCGGCASSSSNPQSNGLEETDFSIVGKIPANSGKPQSYTGTNFPDG